MNFDFVGGNADVVVSNGTKTINGSLVFDPNSPNTAHWVYTGGAFPTARTR